QGIDVPRQIGLAAFNGTDLLDGLPVQLATMEAGRLEIGRKAAEIILERSGEEKTFEPRRIELTPQIQLGETLKRS
ncbi:substrate-binding domain-containing protein, partial [Rhodobacteraceae bacterium]|nr:substrate-binding domain-containing protein [Paracoccaceae bacterium]